MWNIAFSNRICFDRENIKVFFHYNFPTKESFKIDAKYT